jgi:hypothetical protein
MKAEKYISGARTSSLSVLPILYLAGQMMFNNSLRYAQLGGTERRMITAWLEGGGQKSLEDQINLKYRYQAADTPLSTPFGRASVETADGHEYLVFTDGWLPINVEQLPHPLGLHSTGGLPNQPTTNLLDEIDLSDSTSMDDGEIKTFADKLGVKDFPVSLDGLQGDRLADLLRKVADAAINKTITVPVIGVECKPDTALWVLALSTLGLLTLTRYALRCAAIDPELGLGEPWSLLEGWSTLDRAVTGGWLLMLLLSGWINGAALLVTITQNIHLASENANLVESALYFTVALLITLASAWTSIGVVSEMLQLREERHNQLRLEVEACTKARAFDIWESMGRPQGKDADIWRQAEEELGLRIL